MNDPEASLPQTIPQAPQPSAEPPPPAGTPHDPHRTADFQAPPTTGTRAELPHVPGFVIEKELARGGMGEVYQARDTALNRTVAVKILQNRFSPDSAIAARFLEEAQITGQLQHPGIPPIYEVGALGEGGRPFLAMKLIKGETLDAKIKRGDKINYLALGETIAQAVGYAHAHGVIHRDLKPPNIMVGAFGEVQVMDWGLAKVLTASGETAARRGPVDAPQATTLYNPRSGTGSNETEAGSVLGTPAYMAPEQAAGENDKIDQRSDVFGLGGVLCAMLTGQPPYVGTDAESVHLQAVRGQTDAAFARLDGCGAEPEVIALCQRCLAFAPGDRPADGNAVATEVAGLRDAAEERAKHAQIERAKAEVGAAEQHKRRQVWLGLAVTLLVGLFASCGLAAWAIHAEGLARTEGYQKEEQRQRADAERQNAVDQADLALAVKHFLQRDVLLLADPATQHADRIAERTFDADVRLRDVLLRAAKAIDGKFPTQPLVEADLRGSIGLSLLGIGRPDLAVPHLERVRTLYAQHRGPDHPDTLWSMSGLAVSYFDLGRYAEARQLFAETLARQKAVLGPDHAHTLMTMNNLANTYADLDRRADALTLYAQTLARWKATDRLDHRSALNCQQSLAANYAALGQHTDALQQFEAVRDRRQATLGRDHPDTLNSMFYVAESYAVLGRYAEALALRAETLARQRATLGPDHPYALKSMASLACDYDALGRHAEGLALHEEALARMKATRGLDHAKTLLTMNHLANSYLALGRRAEALKLYEETLARRKATFGPDHPDTLKTMNNLANCYQALGRRAEALKLYEETLARMKATRGPDHHDTLRSMSNLADTYADLGRHADALALHEQTLPRMKATLGANHPDTLASMNSLALCYCDLGRHADALPLYREASAIHEWRAADYPRDLKNLLQLGGVQCNLGNTLCQQAKFAESLPAYGRAMEHLHTVLRPQPQNATARLYLGNTHFGRAKAYEQLRRYAEADADWAKVLDLSPTKQKAAVTKGRDQWKAKRTPATSGKP